MCAAQCRRSALTAWTPARAHPLHERIGRGTPRHLLNERIGRDAARHLFDERIGDSAIGNAAGGVHAGSPTVNVARSIDSRALTEMLAILHSHPIASGVVGSASGLGGAVAFFAAANVVLAFIAGLFGAFTAVITFVVVLQRYSDNRARRRARHARRLRLTRAEPGA